jgi:hypothetical protein
MATDFIYPTAMQLRAIEQQKLPRLLAARPWAQFFPPVNVDTPIVSWEQMDNFGGLQQARGLDGAPHKIVKKGAKRYTMQPGVYGEFALIDETELTLRRQWGSLTQRINIGDLVTVEQDRLLERELDRIEWIVWTLLVAGTFSVPTPEGAIVHTDSYTTQTYTAGVTWATIATAVPIQNFRDVQLLARGYSVRFDGSATAFLNRTTANNLFRNQNQNDFFGRRLGLGTLNSLEDFNRILMQDDLPQLVTYDEGYYDDTGTFQLYIPNGKVVVIGNRTSGARIGEYQMTPNANNPGLSSGPYTKVVDNGEDGVPRSIAVHRGHSGGPALLFPSAVVLMNV